jgi:hypothetical protein
VTLKEKVCVNNPHPLEELKKMLGILYSSPDMCLETCSHDVKHAQKQRNVTFRLFYKIMHYSKKVDCELSATTGDLCEKSAMSAAAAGLRIICPPYINVNTV